MTLTATGRHYADAEQISRYDLERIQDNVTSVLDELARKPHLDSNLIEGVELVAGVENLLEHGLGRKVRGFWVVDQSAAIIVWRVTTSTEDLTKFLPLGTTDAATISLVVF